MPKVAEIGLTILNTDRSRGNALLVAEKRTLGRTGGKNGAKKA